MSLWKQLSQYQHVTVLFDPKGGGRILFGTDSQVLQCFVVRGYEQGHCLTRQPRSWGWTSLGKVDHLFPQRPVWESVLSHEQGWAAHSRSHCRVNSDWEVRRRTKCYGMLGDDILAAHQRELGYKKARSIEIESFKWTSKLLKGSDQCWDMIEMDCWHPKTPRCRRDVFACLVGIHVGMPFTCDMIKTQLNCTWHGMVR